MAFCAHQRVPNQLISLRNSPAQRAEEPHTGGGMNRSVSKKLPMAPIDSFNGCS